VASDAPAVVPAGSVAKQKASSDAGGAFAFEARLLVGQAQETAVSKKLASWLAIIAVPTAIAGIYGMNFKNMPELQWEYGYFAILGFMLVVMTILFWQFRRVGWL
jgi:magnesium transporter